MLQAFTWLLPNCTVGYLVPLVYSTSTFFYKPYVFSPHHAVKDAFAWLLLQSCYDAILHFKQHCCSRNYILWILLQGTVQLAVMASVHCRQPVMMFVEGVLRYFFPNTKMFHYERTVRVPVVGIIMLSPLRLIGRSIAVAITTVLASAWCSQL